MPLQAKQRIVAFALLALIAAAVVGLIFTRDSDSPAQRTGRRTPLVDEQPVQTARNVAALARSREEQRYAHQALRLADHAVDLAFAGAMREAALHPAANTPEAQELFARVKRAEAQVQSDQEIIDALKKELEKAKGSSQESQQQIDLLQAQMELDKDELDDAKADLLRSGADSLGRVQRQFARYQAAQQQNEAARAQLNLPSVEAVSARNVAALFKTWRAQRAKISLLEQARQETLAKRDELKEKHKAAEQSGENQTNSEPAMAGVSQDQAVINSLRHLAERHKKLADISNRIQDHQDLADVYGNWLAFVLALQKSTLHAILQSALLVLLIILGVYLADLAVDHFFVDLIQDRRRMRTLRTILRFALQAAGVLFVLFVLFGMPSQMSTILGLAGAGLTVVLKDFIVAFFGWFALMGRNGIRVGDWVEIQGVVGEVAEIGLLRTVLLETGNWNDAGHPTGRKVAFINSFAIEGHYFNFSTSGQWLWDELRILVPSNQDPYPIIDGIQKLVTATTEAYANSAQEEWKRATRDRMHSVSAAPAINLRPTPSGVEVHIRYITQAQERYATRTKLYQDIADLMHQRSELVESSRKS